jgi:hypothetical protein
MYATLYLFTAERQPVTHTKQNHQDPPSCNYACPALSLKCYIDLYLQIVSPTLSLPAQCSDPKHKQFVSVVQETHGYKFEGYIIFTHRGDTACNNHYKASA